MKLGEIIKEYAEEHSISSFINDSGLSKAYVYMLINNKNNKGEPIVPSIETIKKVAAGVHSTFEDVFNKLDYDFVVKVEGQAHENLDRSISKDIKSNTEEFLENKEMRLLIDAAKDCTPEDLQMAVNLLMRLKGR